MVGGLWPAAGQSPERGGRCERGSHCKWNGRDERSDPIGTVDLELAAGWHCKRGSLVTNLGGVCMQWGEGIHKDLIVQAIPWQVCILPSSLAEQGVVLNGCLRCELPEKHCHEGLIFHQG